MYRQSVDEKQGIMIIRRDNEDIESMIKRFKKKVNRSGILREVKNNTFYEKPSMAKKRKRAEAKIRREKDEQKLKMKRSYNRNDKNSGD